MQEEALEEARELFPVPFHSYHEGLGVLMEEFTEVQEEVFKKRQDPRCLLTELLQLAANCQRMAEDLIMGKLE